MNGMRASTTRLLHPPDMSLMGFFIIVWDKSKFCRPWSERWRGRTPRRPYHGRLRRRRRGQRALGCRPGVVVKARRERGIYAPGCGVGISAWIRGSVVGGWKTTAVVVRGDWGRVEETTSLFKLFKLRRCAISSSSSPQHKTSTSENWL